MKRHAPLWMLALLPFGGCTSLPETDTASTLRGTFGGASAVLIAADSSAQVELDCAHGRTNGPVRLWAGGRFDVSGTLVQEGGPVRADAPENARPARFTGHFDGETLQLRIVLADGASGPFTLRRDARPQLYKCL